MEEDPQNPSIKPQSNKLPEVNQLQAEEPPVKLPQIVGSDKLGRSHKTLWNILKVAVVPLVLVLIASVFGWFQTNANLEFSRNQARIAEAQRQTDLSIATDQRLESILQNYLDRMDDLVTNNNLHNPGQAGQDVRNLARARTLTTLRLLDGSRKGIVLRFLSYTGLINREPSPIVNLAGADLKGADLTRFGPGGADLAKVDLTNANLTGADLSGAYLAGAILTGANLTGAKLRFAKLSNQQPNQPLEVVNLTNANLTNADLTGADLTGAIWSNTICPNGVSSKTNGLGHC